ncbi:hypothetical protein ABVT39_014306, partial [Epinephelus coioides]
MAVTMADDMSEGSDIEAEYSSFLEDDNSNELDENNNEMEDYDDPDYDVNADPLAKAKF